MGANNELLADCFAGVWAYVAFYENYLEPGDLEEALAALAAIGDGPLVSVDPHGTPEERMNAFEIGYYGSLADPRPGVPGICIGAFWP